MARKKKKSDLQVLQTLLRKWAFYFANRLMNEYNLTRKAAFKQAFLTLKLMDALGRGEVLFVYEKQDGTLREARGTLCHGISEAFDNYKYKTDVTDNDRDTGTNITYWDLDREAFRSFSVLKLKEIM